ncbi:MAG: DUF6252 family protein [Bacteroidales bacterium]
MKENNEQNNNQTPTNGAMTCKVNGTSWTASLAVVATDENGLLTVTGSDSNAHQCQVSVFNHTGTGTYSLGGSITNPNLGRWTEGLSQNDTYSTMVGLGSGTLEITELTATNVKGTFSFTAKNGAGTEVSVTEGSFDAPINQ